MSKGIVINPSWFDTRVLPLCEAPPQALQLAFRVFG